VSYSKVRALTRVAAPDTEATLLEMARSSTAAQMERICRGYRRAMLNAAGERPEDEAERRWVRVRETEAGLVRFEVQLRPDEAAVVHVDAAALAESDAAGALDDGTPLAPGATERLLCDAAIVEVVEDSRGNVLDVGRRRRTIPTLLRRALRLRDRGCRFPG